MSLSNLLNSSSISIILCPTYVNTGETLPLLLEITLCSLVKFSSSWLSNPSIPSSSGLIISISLSKISTFIISSSSTDSLISDISISSTSSGSNDSSGISLITISSLVSESDGQRSVKSL